jgi:hypothetical protein
MRATPTAHCPAGLIEAQFSLWAVNTVVARIAYRNGFENSTIACNVENEASTRRSTVGAMAQTRHTPDLLAFADRRPRNFGGPSRMSTDALNAMPVPASISRIMPAADREGGYSGYAFCDPMLAARQTSMQMPAAPV